MKHYNKKALEAVKKNANAIYSYLEADIKKPEFNHIVTVPVNERNAENGYANFRFDYIDAADIPQHAYVRVETNVFNGQINLKPTKAEALEKADLIVFYDTINSALFIADRQINQKNNWLRNKSIRSVATYEIDGKQKSSYIYNVDSLMKMHGIFEIVENSDLETITLVHDTLMSYFKGIVMKLNSDTKKLNDYNLSFEHIKYVQFDARDRETIYYRFVSEKATEHTATLPGLTEYISKFTSISKKLIYQRLYRAKSGKTQSFCVPYDVKEPIDKNFLNESGEIEIVLSEDYQDDKQIKKSDSEEYRNMYRKVTKYMKTHTEPRASWTDEEKALFNKLLKSK